jgi:radical SAM protein with 4Fe4S-binding SPASM domain
VISSYNDSLNDVKSLVSFFSGKKYFIGWAFNSAKYSMHNKKYLDYKPSKKNVMSIQEYFKEINEKKIFKFSITPPPIVVSPNDISINSKKQIFKYERDVCSGNFNSIYILPDGKVTICEELYWTPKFIIGDLMKNSIVEVWNSEKAINLYNLQQSDISPKSVCSKCNDYDACRKVKHVCWRDVVMYYGEEN